MFLAGRKQVALSTCIYCGKDFVINPFGSGGKNRLYCYECLPEGLSKSERKQITEYLNHAFLFRDKINRGCDNCGYNKNATVLEWHHPNSDKEFNPSNLLRRGAIDQYCQEISKCILLCANCHRELHHPNYDKDFLFSEQSLVRDKIISNHEGNLICDNNFFVDKINQVLEYYKSCYSVKATAEFFGCDPLTISSLVKENGVFRKVIHNKKPVVMLDLDGNELQRFDSISNALTFLDKPAKNANTISRACRGERAMAYGYKWRFI